MLTLRPYQEDAVESVYQHLRTRDDNPCVVIPTGAGKTPVIATICRDATQRWDGRVLVLSHVKELVQQSYDKLHAIDPTLKVGINSASLRRRDTRHNIIVASIQSVYRSACVLGRFDLVLADECHLIPPEGDGTYRQFLREALVVNPQLRVVGFTATPFRLSSGLICSPDHFLNHICYEVGVRELIRDNYLCPLVSKAGAATTDISSIPVRQGEFVAAELEDAVDTDDLVAQACQEIVSLTQERRSVLIFATGVRHAQHVQRELEQRHGVECGFVCGATPMHERDATIERFRAGQLKYLVNVNVLSIGFDATNVDCVVLLRPTMSPGLYVQTVGRGFRLHPGKKDCLVLDFGGNVLRHGPVDQIRATTRRTGGTQPAPAKQCPECSALIATGYATCPQCAFVFPPPHRRQHAPRASEAGILSGQVTDTEYVVRDVMYAVHQKRGADDDAPRTLRVSYRLGLGDWQHEYICVEHSGPARRRAIQWWRQRSPDPVPQSADEAVAIADGGGLAPTERITVRSVAGEKYDSIVHYALGPLPEPLETLSRANDEEVPF